MLYSPDWTNTGFSFILLTSPYAYQARTLMVCINFRFHDNIVVQNIRGVIKRFSAQYASLRFIELKPLSVGHLI